MKEYYCEVTDLFNGELNYSFVQRYLIKAKSERGAIQKLARELGLNFRIAYDNVCDRVYFSTSKLTGVVMTEFDQWDEVQRNCYKQEL